MITGMPRIAIAAKDFDSIIATFRDKLGMPVTDLSTDTIGSLGAALGMCTPGNGSNIELMSPADPEAPLSQSLERFLDRRGEGHFALMLEAADPDIEAESLSQRDLNVMPRMKDAGGRDVHPNSTHGVLIRVYPTHSYSGPYTRTDVGPPSPGLTGIGRVIIAVKDLDAAVDTYGRKFAMQISKTLLDETRGVCCATCTPPTGGVIELVTPVNSTAEFAIALEQFLFVRGEGMYALVLGCEELAPTAQALKDRGMNTSLVAGIKNTLELDPASTFGARIFVEQQ